jgi:holo-[acyl-carrier protein] synthase
MSIGVDLIEIERVERALARHPRLAERLFSDAELEYARARRRPGRHLAARFAAKEAALKALGAGDGLGLGDIEVVAGAPPTLRLHGRVAATAAEQGVELRVSLTHSRETAAAVALAVPTHRHPERGRPTPPSS